MKKALILFFSLAILSPTAHGGNIRNYGFMAGTIPLISITFGVLIASAFQNPDKAQEKMNAENRVEAQNIIDHQLISPRPITYSEGESRNFSVQ